MNTVYVFTNDWRGGLVVSEPGVKASEPSSEPAAPAAPAFCAGND